MAKLYANNKIIRVVNGQEEVIEARTVFDADTTQARQLIDQGAARNARQDEVEAAEVLAAKAAGKFYGDEAEDAPSLPLEVPKKATTGIEHDPKGQPKGTKD